MSLSLSYPYIERAIAERYCFWPHERKHQDTKKHKQQNTLDTWVKRDEKEQKRYRIIKRGSFRLHAFLWMADENPKTVYKDVDVLLHSSMCFLGGDSHIAALLCALVCARFLLLGWVWLTASTSFSTKCVCAMIQRKLPARRATTTRKQNMWTNKHT